MTRSFHFNFAISYLMLGDVKNAQEQQQQLQAIDPNMAQHLATAIARRHASGRNPTVRRGCLLSDYSTNQLRKHLPYGRVSARSELKFPWHSS